jgi:acetyl-CoA carboxylase carboxyl transferase subunit beta
MGLFDKTKKLRKVGKDISGKSIEVKSSTPEVPADIYTKCPSCDATIRKEQIKSHDYSCPSCNAYFRMRAYDRIKMICDSFTEIDTNLRTVDPLGMPGYKEKIKTLNKKTGLDDALISGYATIHGQKCMMFVMDSNFMMASMGSVVGEKITRVFEKATAKKLPVVGFVASGGARMQEGLYSLMQMAKTSAAVARHSDKGLFYLNVLTHPTTGGVTASFAMLADITLAEPGGLIGFAGPRVIKQTIGQDLPEGFQTSEFVKETGFIDKIVERSELRETISKLIAFHN